MDKETEKEFDKKFTHDYFLGYGELEKHPTNKSAMVAKAKFGKGMYSRSPDNVKEIKSFVSKVEAKAYQAGREEALEEVEIWAYNNGITHKKCFVELKNFLQSLEQKEGK